MAEAAEMSLEQRLQDMLAVEDGEQPESMPERPEEILEEPEEIRGEQRVEAEPDEPDAPDAQEIELRSLKDLAKHTGLAIEDLYQLEIAVPTKEDPNRRMTLGEWKDAMQLNNLDDYSQEVEQLNAEREATRKAAQEAQQRSLQFSQWLQTAAQQTEAVINMAEQELMREYQSVDWGELEQIDPGEAALKRQKFNERYGYIQQQKQNAVQQFQQRQQQFMAQQLPYQAELLNELVPEWKNPDTASAEKPRVAEYLAKIGYQPHEINQIAHDARSLAAAYKAWKYDESRAGAKSIPAKKVLKVAKRPLKPGKSQSKAEQRENVARDERQKFRKTGSIKDLANLLNSDEYLGEF